MNTNEHDTSQPVSYSSSDEQLTFYQKMKLLTDPVFNKQFVYPDIDSCEWSEETMLNSLFSESRWNDPVLQGLKKELNEKKSLLNDLDIVKWHNHTTQTHPGGLVMKNMRKHFNAEMCTQAWCKCREIVHRLDLSRHLQGDQLRSVHLCEAPGAFITSFNHYLRNKGFMNYWIWLGMTLNPYYEGNSPSSMIADDQFINKTLEHWYFGTDNTGDVMNLENVNGLIEICRDMGYAHLVTADGSIDCADKPGEQEDLTSALHYSEVAAALNILQPGGHLVLKTFTLFEDHSVSLMYILRSCFDKLTVLKPVTSKPGNSELYVMAEGFRGLPDVFLQALLSHIGSSSHDNTCILPAHAIPDKFLVCHRVCCQTFTRYQMDAISENLCLFGSERLEDVARLKMLREGCQAEYVQRYEISAIDRREWIVYTPGRKPQTCHFNYNSVKWRQTGSYVARQQKQNLSWKDRVRQISLFPDEMPACLPWLEHNISPSKEVIDTWFPVRGRAFQQINSSRFCETSLLQLYNDILTHAQSLETDMSEEVFRLFHESSLQSVKVLFGDSISVMKINNKDELSDMGQDDQSQSSDDAQVGPGGRRLVTVNCYSPHVNEQSWLVTVHPLCILLHLLTSKLLKCDDDVLLTIPPPLTRISASLVYIFRCCFDKVTMVIPKQTAFPVCYLIGDGYRSCSEDFLSYLTTVGTCHHDTTTCAELSRIPDKLLEVIPFHCLCEQKLYQLLLESNETFAKRRINSILSKERQFLEATN